jgi:hypothetical protein
VTLVSRLRTGIVPACAVPLCLALSLALLAPAHATAGKLPSEKQWRQDVARVMKGSHAFIDRRTAGTHTRLAINMDIDNSALATHYRRGTATPAVHSFAVYAHRHGVALLFNTARSGAPLRRARAELTKAGYPVTRVCGRKSRSEPSAHGKQRCRARFRAAGYTIIANVGNRATDFSGPRNYGKAYRLPNYGNQLS